MSWFPRFNRLGELTWEEVGFWQRQWLDDTRRIWQDGTNTVIDGTPVGPAFTRLAAGGGKWRGSTPDHADPAFSFSGRHAWIENPQSNAKRLMVDGIAEPIAVGPIVEMRISDTGVAWKQGDDVYAYADGQVKLIAREAGWPVPVDTPHGLWIVMMRGSGTWTVPFSHPEAGYQRDTGGQSFYPDAIWWDGQIVIAETNSSGQLPASLPSHSLAEPRKPYSVAATPPPPPPPVDPPEPQPMPNIEALTRGVLVAVESVNQSHPHLLRTNTKESCGEFTERVVNMLASADPLFGHVGKQPGQTNYRLHAVDAVMYQSPKQVWDIIGGAENHPHPGQPTANPVAHGDQPWMAPIPVAGEPTPPPPPPNPPPASDVQQQIDALHGMLQSIGVSVIELKERVEVLEDAPELPPVPPLPKLRAKGKTSAAGGGWWGKSHQHDIDVEVVPE